MRTRLLALVTVLVCLLPGAPAGAEAPMCTPSAAPGLDGCIPSPLECATGEFNGVWTSANDEREAVCDGWVDASGRGHIREYVGGDASVVCGAIIRDDRVVAGGWQDPNQMCGAYGVGTGYGIPGNRYQPAAQSRHGAVATTSTHAADAALQVLARGGNAVDAAVAAVFVVGVARQESCGIGGGGFLVYRGADGTTAALDFRERAPAALPIDFEENTTMWGTGHRVAGVPGTVAGMAAALDRYGSMPLRRLLRPAIALAEQGVGLTARQADVLRALHASRLARYPASRALYFEPDGSPRRPYPIGDLLVQPDLAWSLRAIADRGPRAFYRGEIAKRIVAEMEASQADPDIPDGDAGVMTAHDLADYQAVWREPVRGTYRGHHIVTMGAPTSGGIAVVEMLNLLEGFELAQLRPTSADHLHLVAEAKKLAWADRNAYLADPEYVAVPTDELVAKWYADQRRPEIDLATAGSYAPGRFDGYTPRPPGGGDEGTDTAHVSVVDGAGNAASVTCTIEQGYGSAVVVPGTGILLNSQLTDFDEAGSANEPAPGKRPRSSTTPVIVSDDAGVARLVLGGVGGPFIPAAVAQVISNVVDFGMDPALALDVARVDGDECCTLSLEQHRVPDEERESLRGRGHTLVDPGQYALWGPYLQLVGAEADGVTRFAASDPRDDLGAAVLEEAPQR